MFNSSLFDEKERNIIIMALMYLKNDYTPEDLADLGIDDDEDGWAAAAFEDVVQNLMEDIIGPTWDEEETTKNLKTETAKRTRDKS